MKVHFLKKRKTEQKNITREEESRKSLFSAYSFPPKSLSIYIHFPWCLQKCHYCDFYSIGLNHTKNTSKVNNVSTETVKEYENAILREFTLRLTDRRFGFRNYTQVSSIFFGGGTPSLLPIDTIERMLSFFREEFTFAPECEISLEGNPENLTPEYLSSLKSAGINRINVGVQSLDSKILRSMNRFYSEEHYGTILHNLQNSPISHFGVDLIYGFPGQTEDLFYEDLDTVLSIQPNHLSIYSLTAEDSTMYGHSIKDGTSLPPNEEIQSSVWKQLVNRLDNFHLTQYEVSNFAKDHYWSLHNLRYWLYEPYLALGPGAHGFDGYFRYENPRNFGIWLKNPADNLPIAHKPLLEVPLMLLRLCGPFPLGLWESVLLQKCNLPYQTLEKAQECLETWYNKGWLDSFYFQNQKCYQWIWDQEGLLFLDDRILEMNNSLS